MADSTASLASPADLHAVSDQASRRLVAPERLRRSFAPRNVARGVTVDPACGLVLAAGLGGAWVEIMRDTSLRVLPVDAAEVRRMLGELRAPPLLQGARGSKPADLDAVATAISKVSEVALSLGGALRAMEVNPLWVNGDQVEALDVLVITEPDGSTGTEPAGSTETE